VTGRSALAFHSFTMIVSNSPRRRGMACTAEPDRTVRRIGTSCRSAPTPGSAYAIRGHSGYLERHTRLPPVRGHLVLSGRESTSVGGRGDRTHSITWSARCSSDGGIVRPRALAVLRLMTSSNLVGR
jgi:hypothetical protein